MNNEMEKRLLDVDELCVYIGMGRSKGVEWAKKIGASVRIGRRLLFDKNIIDKAIDEARESDT